MLKAAVGSIKFSKAVLKKNGLWDQWKKIRKIPDEKKVYKELMFPKRTAAKIMKILDDMPMVGPIIYEFSPSPCFTYWQGKQIIKAEIGDYDVLPESTLIFNFCGTGDFFPLLLQYVSDILKSGIKLIAFILTDRNDPDYLRLTKKKSLIIMSENEKKIVHANYKKMNM